MKKIFRYFAIVLLTSLVAVGCVRDNGNYDYTELPEMEVTSFSLTKNGDEATIYDDNTILASKGDSIILVPTYSIDENISPAYQWTIYDMNCVADDSGYYPSAEVISTESALYYTLNQLPGEYVINLTITSNVNEAYKQIISFNVNIETVKGLYVLWQDADGNGDISIFRTYEMDSNLGEGNVFTDNNFLTRKNDGRGIYKPTVMNINYYNVITLSGENCIYTYDTDFVLTSDDHSSLFSSAGLPTEDFSVDFFGSHNVGGATRFDFMVSNGKLYGNTVGYSNTVSGFFTKNDYEYFPKVSFVNTFGGHLVYNNTLKSFQHLNEGFGYYLWGMYFDQKIEDMVSSGGDIDISNTGMLIVDFAQGNNSELVAIFSDYNDGMYCATFTWPVDNSEGIPASQCLTKVSLGSVALEADVWEFGTRGDYAFFAVGNKLYTLSVKTGEIEEAEVEISSDEIITSIKLFSDSDNVDYDSAMIFVATNKGTAEGSVYQFEIRQTTGRVIAETKQAFTGFGEIKDLYYVN